MSEIQSSETVITRNRVAEIISKMGFKPEPSNERLKELNLTMHRFNKVIENTVELTSSELVNISAWLKVEIKDLFETK